MEQNKKILIIEDDAAMRATLIHRFESEHFAVYSTSDGPSGLARALEEKPDIILLDIMMPGFDGMTVMKKLRQADEWGKHVPIILLTSLEADDNIIRGITEDEPAYYVVKDDLKLSDLVEKVNERLSRTL